VVIQSYVTDNRAFKAAAFVEQIRNTGQRIQYCGTNAHHQNGVAEQSIRTISNMTRALILHAAAHWKDGIDSSLWPMAIAHATHIYNHTPNSSGICPADIFTGNMIPPHRLKDLHVWGCPVYILDPTLQKGSKLPRWQPRSRRGIYMGTSPIHSSDVPLVLNIHTGSITAKFHVVFDDKFTTVHSVERETDPPDFWDDLCLENTLIIPSEGSDAQQPPLLAHEWLTESERASKIQEIGRRDRIRNLLAPKHMQTPLSIAPTNKDAPVTSNSSNFQTSSPVAASILPSSRNEPTEPSIPAAVLADHISPVPIESTTPVRRSQQTTKGTFTSSRYFDEVFLTPLDQISDCDAYTQQLAYVAGLHTCYDTGLENISDPRVYAAKHCSNDLDSPTFHQAINGENSEEYIKAMQIEVSTLVQQRTWKPVARKAHMNVLKGNGFSSLSVCLMERHPNSKLDFVSHECPKRNMGFQA
jgi:hypothetical protein